MSEQCKFCRGCRYWDATPEHRVKAQAVVLGDARQCLQQAAQSYLAWKHASDGCIWWAVLSVDEAAQAAEAGGA